uniref:Uncharacterized protein n=1 Tax=Parastrongyloides trichosuri TaxID=131310 RepID=A0A0N4ZAH8_PARTI
MKFLQNLLFFAFSSIVILSVVVSQTIEQVTESTAPTTISPSPSKGNKLGTDENNLNKISGDKKRKYKIRNQTKFYNLKKTILETELRNVSGDKNVTITKKSNETSSDSNNVKIKTKNQLINLQKELRKLTKIAEKLAELNEASPSKPVVVLKKKSDIENTNNKSKKYSFSKKNGSGFRGRMHHSKFHNNDNDRNRKNKEQNKNNKGNEEGKQNKGRFNKKNEWKKHQSTTRGPIVNATTLPTTDSNGHIVTSNIQTRQQKRRFNKKHDMNTSSTGFKHSNTILFTSTTVFPQ